MASAPEPDEPIPAEMDTTTAAGAISSSVGPFSASTITPDTMASISSIDWTLPGGTSTSSRLDHIMDDPSTGPAPAAADGTIVIDPEDGDSVTAKLSGSTLVCGKGDTPVEAIEDLQESIRLLLDFVYGANGERATLHPDFLADVTQLIGYAKGLGIHTP